MAQRVIGLDIGSSAVRAAQVSLRGRGLPTLERVGQVLLPPGAVSDGEIADPDAVVDALRALWSRYGFKGRRVWLGLANQQVIVRLLDVPYLPDEELAQSLQYQVQDSIPIAVDQALLDFHTVEVVETPEGQRLSRLLLVAAQREMVNRVVDVVRRAKLDPVGIDLAAFAMLRSVAPVAALDAEGGELVIDVGAAVTNVVVHDGGVPRFVRMILMGGNAVTDALVDQLDMPYEEAEQAKASVGMAEEYGLPLNASSRVITERASRFIEEIRGSVDYYRAQPDAVPLERVVLSGGASRLPNLRERLADALRLPVDYGHPMQELKVGPVRLPSDQLQAAEPYLAVAIGLALGAAA